MRGRRASAAARGREASWAAARAGVQEHGKLAQVKRRARELPVAGGEAAAAPAHRIWEEEPNGFLVVSSRLDSREDVVSRFLAFILSLCNNFIATSPNC